MTKKRMMALLADAIIELSRAATELTSETVPWIPIPRPRIFYITKKWTYPYVEQGRVSWKSFRNPRGESEPISTLEINLASELGNAVKWRPRAVLRTLRRIQAATAWCRARAEGRRRAAQEILRQQRKSVEALEAEAAVRELGR